MLKDLIRALQGFAPRKDATLVQRLAYFWCLFFPGKVLELVFGGAGLIFFFCCLILVLIWVNLPAHLQEKMIARLPD